MKDFYSINGVSRVTGLAPSGLVRHLKLGHLKSEKLDGWTWVISARNLYNFIIARSEGRFTLVNRKMAPSKTAAEFVAEFEATK